MAVHLSSSRRWRALGAVIATALAGSLFTPVAPVAADAVVRSDPGAANAPLLQACPIDGDSTYEDSWGWARSGGRRHKGVDMVAERGTPILAVHDGDATFKNTRLGGRSIWIETVDGDRFFYAHLDGWEGESRPVEAGEVIGYVGSTGNAGGTHLHFETRPGGVAENPYPHVVRACREAARSERVESDPPASDSWQWRIPPEPFVNRIALANARPPKTAI